MKFVRVMCVATALIVATASDARAQTAPLTILVAGSPVVSSRPAERTEGEWFIPLVAVARALDFDVQIAPGDAGLRARSRTGIQTDYDGRSGEVRYGQVVIGRVKNYRQVVIAAPLDNLLFPVSGIVALFGVDVTEQPERLVLRVEPSNGFRNGPTAPSFTLAGLDYSVGMTTGEGQLQHYTSLHGEAIAGGVALSTQWLLNGNGSRVGVRQGFGQADFGGRRVAGAGDQMSHTSLDSQQTAYRGVSFRRPTGAGFETEAYAGRPVGAIAISRGELGLASYEGTVAGIGTSRQSKTGELSFAGQWFDGIERRGVSAGAAFVRVTPRHQLKLQMSFGDFSGLSARTTLALPPPVDRGLFDDGSTLPDELKPTRAPVDGTAVGAGVLYTLTPVTRVSVTMQAERYGKNFLTAKEDSQFNAQSSQRGSVTIRPFQGTSIFAGLNRRVLLLGVADRLTGRHVGVNSRVPGLPLQLGFFTSRQRDTSSATGAIDMTQYSASMFDARRLSGNAYYTETTFSGQTTRNVGGTIGHEFAQAGRISVLGQWQVAGARRVGIEWQRELPSVGGMIRAAIERMEFAESGRDVRYVPQGSIAITLPFGQRLHASYSGYPGNRTLSVALSGPLARRNDVRRRDDRISIEALATLTGRVYFDADSSGDFRAATDRGLPEVRIWLDDHQSALTDRDGVFRFEHVAPGARVLRAELDNVPADQVFATSAERTVAAVPYGQNTQDFRVVRTGSVKASVLIVLPGPEEGQTMKRPLPDARVVAVLPLADGDHTPQSGPSDLSSAESARAALEAPFDSYTDLFGKVMVTALPPGTYDLKLDPDSLPKGYGTTPSSIRVEIRAGETADEVQFVVALIPKAIIRKEPGKGIDIGGTGTIGGGGGGGR